MTLKFLQKEKQINNLLSAKETNKQTAHFKPQIIIAFLVFLSSYVLSRVKNWTGITYASLLHNHAETANAVYYLMKYGG